MKYSDFKIVLSLAQWVKGILLVILRVEGCRQHAVCATVTYALKLTKFLRSIFTSC